MLGNYQMKRTLLIAASCLSFVGSALAQGDATRAKFEEYVKGRLPQMSARQVTRIAELVDKNGDGKISDAEFEGRMRAVAKVREGGEGEDGDDRESGADHKGGEPVAIAPLTKDGAATLLLITGCMAE